MITASIRRPHPYCVEKDSGSQKVPANPFTTAMFVPVHHSASWFAIADTR